jgi:hypothetical protein
MSTIPGIPYGPIPRAARYAYPLTQWDLIVVHDTGHHNRVTGAITSAEGEARYAATRTDERKYWTSCHAYIDEGGPLGSLSLDLQAWAALGWANGRGIHLEMCGENAGTTAAVPPATIAHTAALVRRIAALKNIPLVKLSPGQLGAAARTGSRVRGICGHYDITVGLGVGSHDDPGPRFDWAGFMAQVNGAAAPEGDDMGLTPLQAAQVNNSERYLQAMFNLVDKAVGISDTVTSQDKASPAVAAFKQLLADLAAVRADVAELRNQAPVVPTDAQFATLGDRIGLHALDRVNEIAERVDQIAASLAKAGVALGAADDPPPAG